MLKSGQGNRSLLVWGLKMWLPLLITGGVLVLMTMTVGSLIKKETTVVQVDNLPLRQAPGYRSKEVGRLKSEERVTVLATKNDWVEVRRTDESTGWVLKRLFDRQEAVPKPSILSEMTIVLDAGHGGSDSGALSNSDKYEKHYTLAMAQQARDVLVQQYGAKVVMTRDGDDFVDLPDIPKVSEKAKADLFVSFHFDAAPERNTASGFTTYYYHKKDGSERLAEDVNKVLAPKMPKFLSNRGAAYGDYLVLRDSKIPAILLENGFINSDRDFKLIADKQYRQMIAETLPKGLETFAQSQVKSA